MTFTILEGIDRAGKTTLADKIVKQLEEDFPDDQIITVHHSQPKLDAYSEYIKPYSDYAPGTGTHFVIDRHYVGEDVYGPIYRGRSMLSDGDRRNIEMWLQSIGAIVVQVSAAPHVIRERIESDGEDFLQDQHIEEVLDKFDVAISRSPVHRASVTTTLTDLNYVQSVDQIVDLAKYEADRAAVLNQFGGLYTGRAYPTGLIVTDELTQAAKLALYDALPDVPTLGLIDLTFAESDDARAGVMEDIIDVLLEPPVIALGDSAQVWAHGSWNNTINFDSPDTLVGASREDAKAYGLKIVNLLREAAAE